MGPLSKLFKTPPPAPLPEIPAAPPPVEMPDPANLLEQQRARRAVAQRRRGGRAATRLTGSPGLETLG